MVAPPLVELDQVNKWFGDLHVLKDIDLRIAPREVVVIGPSSSGKSTLCRCINRLERVQSGQIRIDGTPLPEEGKELARLRAEVGMVFSPSTCSRTRPRSEARAQVRPGPEPERALTARRGGAHGHGRATMWWQRSG